MDRLKKARVFIKINQQDYLRPHLFLNVDAVSIKDGEPVPEQPINVAFQQQIQQFSTNENGEATNVDLVFDCVSQDIRDKLRVWIDGVDEPTEYDFISPLIEEQIKLFQKKANDAAVEVENLKKKGKHDDYQREIDRLKGENARLTEALKKKQSPIAEIKVPDPYPNKQSLKERLSARGIIVIKKGEKVQLPRETYEINCDLHIEDGGEVIIEPGCTIKFRLRTGIVCKGRLTALGSKELPINFDCSDKEKKWNNVFLIGQNAEGKFRYCTFARGGGRDLYCDQIGHLVVDDNTNQHKQVRVGGALGFTFGAHGIIDNCCIENCEAENGGGVFVYMVIDLKITDSKVRRNAGGGITTLESSSPIIENCLIEGNKSDCGAGILIAGKSNPKISDCEILGNIAADAGGGIFIAAGSNPTIADTVIRSNYADYGGGMCITTSAYAKLKKLTVVCNRCSNQYGCIGGGILVIDAGSADMEKLMITHNIGGGVSICATEIFPKIEYCTIIENKKSGDRGTGIELFRFDDVTKHLRMESKYERNNEIHDNEGDRDIRITGYDRDRFRPFAYRRNFFNI